MFSKVDLPLSRTIRSLAITSAAASIARRWAAAWGFWRRSRLARFGPAAGRRGRVYLVGAGPGDPELLTLRAARLIGAAEVVVHDSLVGDGVLALARAGAELVDVGKRAGRARLDQAAINRLLLAYGLAGRDVVRLKGGDPLIFGRAGEEIDYLAARGISVEIVPGVTAALGCAAAAGIPLTHRDSAHALTLVSGHGRAGGPPLPGLIDFAALADPGHTVAVYMGRADAASLAERLIGAGRSPWTPVVLIENGTLPSQRVARGTLADLGRLAAASDPDRPALIVIGEVVGRADTRFDPVPAFAQGARS